MKARPSFRRGEKPVFMERLRANRSRLGTAPDDEIAAELAVPVHLVSVFRRKEGIPAFSEVRSKIEIIAGRFGVESDVALAREVGLEVATVWLHRVRQGIAPAPRSKSPPPDSPMDVLIRAGQKGPVTSEMARDLLGLTGRQALVKAATRGHFVRVSRGVYRLADPA